MVDIKFDDIEKEAKRRGVAVYMVLDELVEKELAKLN